MILLLIPSAYAQWYYSSQTVTADVKMASQIEIVKLTPSGYVESATINLTFYPKEYKNQELLKFETNPKAEQNNDVLQFQWKSPEDKISFNLNAQVKTTNSIVQIKEKYRSQYKKLPDDILPYTKPSPTIDSDDPEIIRLASQLVEGEDDLYSAVFKLAGWTKNNINYNLGTLTADISPKASWVLENKQGVCDELTSLFIAMARSVGIPARFISGHCLHKFRIVCRQLGAHGWAEVYFPWLWVGSAFDVTYGEFGWVDPTHLKFKESVDSDDPSTHIIVARKECRLKSERHGN